VYTQSKDLARVALQRETLREPVEQLTLALGASTGGGGTLDITWDTTRYWVAFAVAS
jgi:hypothetical protein